MVTTLPQDRPTTDEIGDLVVTIIGKTPLELPVVRDSNPSQYYVLDDDGEMHVPTVMLKGAIIEAEQHFRCIDIVVNASRDRKLLLRQSLHVIGERTKLNGTRHADYSPATYQGETVDVPHYSVFPWAMQITVRYDRRVLTEAELLDLIKISGEASGMGVRRVSKGGMSGQFIVRQVR